MAARKRSGRGGWRPGAGRKKILKDRVRTLIDLERETLDHLRALSRERGVSISALVREVLARYLKRARR